MIVLDTNVLSEVMKASPAERVLNWLDDQLDADISITAITVAEIFLGIETLPEGKRKTALRHHALTLFNSDFPGKVLPFDVHAATVYADIVASSRSKGRTISFADGQIAAICIDHEAVLATRNTKDFDFLDIALINPWQ
jgi:predicted nucleic acid-binding protein